MRNSCTGRGPVHIFQKLGGVAAALVLAATPLSLTGATPAQAAASRAQLAAVPQSEQSVADFYRTRGGAPLWLTPAAGDAAQQLMQLLTTASADGFDSDRYGVDALAQALPAAAGGDRKAVQRADIMLSQAFVLYARDLRQDPGVGMIYNDAEVRPVTPSALTLLATAAAAPSLATYVSQMRWMSPLYAPLRHALANHLYTNEHERQLLALNLKRTRVLPAGNQRYILVNAAEQRLFTYENGEVVDSMRVVVGKPKYPTPMMAAMIRFANLNPYWYVPPDLAGDDVAVFVKKQGLKYLDKMGYQVVSDWDNPTIVDPSTVDWKGVLDGKVEVLIRQLPGPHNFMGRMKFMFPNLQGVYLHDNPERELFSKASRYYSGGCVRLEDAPRLGRWLFGHDLVWQGAGIEEKVPLTKPVPVYITYLTAMPDGTSIAYFDDVYGRDAAKLAAATGNGDHASR